MSTGPGPTRKADGSVEASVDDIADLLVEDESHQGRMEGEQAIDDGLDVMLETPGPALVSTFMPPPPSPVAEDAEESESAEEPGESTNLAYEDLLAKLVLPSKAPEPEPAMPALAAPLPMPETLIAPAEPTPPAVAFKGSSSANFLIAPPTDERTLVTENPLVAEEQEAAYREGRSASREQPLMVQEEMRSAPTEPVFNAANVVGPKSRAFYLTAAVVLVVFGFFLAVVFLKVIAPAPQPPVVITPAPLPLPLAPPAHVEPLPPSAPPAPAAQPEAVAPAAAPPENSALNGEQAAPEQPKAHRASRRGAHIAAPKPAPAPKVAPTPKPATVAPKAASPAPAPATKAPKAPAGKKKTSGYADPFDN